ncbi:MAG TPA: DNA polymerase III subunit epsilon, partial [Pseudohongiella sp.]|nr:DNA polymerase III subunit epsilon [Pseudohongiella sp.]
MPDTDTRHRSPDWSREFRALAQSARDASLKKFYAAGAPAPDTPISEAALLAIDFETTGLDSQSNSIVSIGVVPMSLQWISSSASRHWIVKPRFELTPDSVTIHRITHSDIEEAPDLREILPELLELMAGRVAVVHHRSIERGFLNEALLARLGEGIVFPVIDTMALEARLHRRGGLMTRLLGRRQQSIRLADSRLRYGLPAYSPHHAVSDALA